MSVSSCPSAAGLCRVLGGRWAPRAVCLLGPCRVLWAHEASAGYLGPPQWARCAARPGRAPGPGGTARWSFWRAGRSRRAAAPGARWGLRQHGRAGLREAPARLRRLEGQGRGEAPSAAGLPSQPLGREPGTTTGPACAKKVTLPEGERHRGVRGGGKRADVVPTTGRTTRVQASPLHRG